METKGDEMKDGEDDLLTRRECERFYSKAVRDFDRWFFSLTKDRQAALRESGVRPYREDVCKHYVFPVNSESTTAVVFSPWDPNDDKDNDTFYSREKVEEFTRRLLDTLSYSLDPRVRLHFLIVKIALRMPDAIDGKRVAKLFGITKAGVSFRVQRMRQILAGDFNNEKPNGEARPSSRLRLSKVPDLVHRERRKIEIKGKGALQNNKRTKADKGARMD